MSAKCFIDSNVFVSLFDDTDPTKRQRAEALTQQALQEGPVCISYHVVQETLNVVIRKLNGTAEDARLLLLRVLAPLWQINPTPVLYERSLELRSRYQFSFYDSLIISAALEAGCKTLYSEDLQHGQIIGHLTIVNPFV